MSLTATLKAVHIFSISCRVPLVGHVHGGLRRHQSGTRGAGDDRDVYIWQRRSTGKWRGNSSDCRSKALQCIPPSEKKRMKTNDGELWDSLLFRHVNKRKAPYILDYNPFFHPLVVLLLPRLFVFLFLSLFPNSTGTPNPSASVPMALIWTE